MNKHDKDSPWEWFTKVAGIEMAHNFYVHHIFSEIMDANPQIEQIIELGTYKGAMSIMLGLEGIRKQIPVYTYDISDQTSLETSRLFTNLQIVFSITDIFEPLTREALIDQIKYKPTYLLCDNGRKAEEFEAFGRHLPKGSVISAHDYTNEFHDKDTEPLKNMIEPFMQEDWMRHNAQITTYRIK